ncbi:MAG TPA: hypothetical protein VFN42_00870 [Acetobacteraceae bacterium]|nr:hypothetical protein [Acetobacteraceae bacterium]
MQRKIVLLAAALCGMAGAMQAHAQNAPAMVSQTAKGKVLTDAHGMTLYVFDKDMAGKSMCNGPCIHNWPALHATAMDKPSGDWTIITRDDGAMQWAYKGKPLYTWIKDKHAGDMTGDGVNHVWHVATP